MWITGTLVLLAILFFFVIARKGRELRTRRPLPPESKQAFLEAMDGTKHLLETKRQFYIGRKQECNIVLPNALQDYEVCIFYHRKRFAFQSLAGSEGILVNDDEQLAGYLSNGDVLTIAEKPFIFRCQ